MINKTLPEIEESHSDGNSLYQNAVDVRTDRDLFRKKEKQIKSLLKRVEEDIDPKLRKKRSWGDQKTLLSDDDGEISWEDDIIDARRPNKTNRNGTGLHLTASFPKCLSCLDHECSDSVCEIFELSSHRGFYVIKGALCPSQQLFWAKTAVEKYSRAEHTNLTNLVKQKLEDESTSPREKMIAQSSLGDDLWEKSIVEGNGFHNFKKLRWSCLGYHYNWTLRQYQRNLHSVMPDDFGKLCCSVADVVGTSLLPEAAIINYYPLNSTMGGHLDDAEHNLEKPIVSFSIGRSALFLIGGKTKLEDPHILLLTSGDAIVMSDESRLCYHGVPCILSVQAEQYLSGKDVGLEIYDEKWSNHEDYCHVVNYLRENRLNMNARQVRMNDSEEWVEKSGTGCVKV